MEKTFTLSEQEVSFLVQALNRVQISGIASSQMLLQLVTKLKIEPVPTGEEKPKQLNDKKSCKTTDTK